jgi:hypothetical protein
VTPLPTEETTPPVQKRYFVTLTSFSGFREIGGCCHPVAQQCHNAFAILADNGLFVHCLQLYNPTFFCYNSECGGPLP